MFLLVLTTALSCKKAPTELEKDSNATKEITDYLKQKSNNQSANAARTTTDYYAQLLANIDLNQLTTLQNSKANETIYVVPLINDNNPNQTTVAIFYKYANIEEADIVAVDNGKEATTDFKNVIKFETNTFTGKIETKNIKGDITDIVEMVSGKEVTRKSMEGRHAPAIGNEVPCINYYWVEYYTNENGQQIIISSTFLYQDCGGNIGGGGGSTPVDEEPDAVKQVSWVPSSGNLTTVITYDVTATEKFKGNRYKFKEADVLGIGMNLQQNPSGLGFVHTVQNHQFTSGGAGSSTAVVNAKGKITSGASNFVEYDNNKTWNSHEVF